MLVLAVHTASARLSITFAKGGVGDVAVLLHEDIAEPRDQGNFLLHAIVDGCKKLGLELQNFDMLAAVTGPGSFTGIRIGLAALRGFALAANVRLAGINSFDLYAQLPIQTNHRLVVIESWRDELYVQLDSQPPTSLTPAQCVELLGHQKINPAHVTIMGDAGEKLSGQLAGAVLSNQHADSRTLAALAITKPELFGTADPFYLREADVSFGRANRVLQQEG